jgi:hypothetical protein
MVDMMVVMMAELTVEPKVILMERQLVPRMVD